MMSDKFVRDVVVLLEKNARNEPLPEITEDIINDFGEKCKNILRKMQEGREPSEFKLYFSNMGKSARSLYLEKEHGRVPMDAYTSFKMKYGDMIEYLMVALLQASGANVSDVDKEVSLSVNGVTINGRIDLKLDGGIVDIKTASTYSYDNKFESLSVLKENDSFGYCHQGLGYAIADGTAKFRGWLVIDKVSGHFKFVDATPLNTIQEIHTTLSDIQYKVNVLNGSVPVPECNGVIDEKWNKVPTGRKTLSFDCQYCDHKKQCHPSLTYEQVQQSTAKEKPWRFYVKN